MAVEHRVCDHAAVRRLLAISDLHVANRANREAIEALPDHGDDWLIIAGDVGETLEHLAWTLEQLQRRFARLIWVPGNHDLWSRDEGLRGEGKYRALVEMCRAHEVITPEDPFPVFESADGPLVVAPLFLLYDYTFRPDHVGDDDVLSWAREAEILCTDELLLHPAPFESRADWCASRCAESERRLAALDPDLPTVLVNHWPLRYDLVHIPRIPRFSPWCGTRRTEDWHRRYRAEVVVYGHLHVRGTTWRDEVRCEEVSFGYPRQWRTEIGLAGYLRDVLTPDPGAGQPRQGP